MANILDILTRAQALRQETALNSITPDRAGGIMYDTLILINQMQLEGGSLLISKVYSSVAAMEADTTPTSDLTGRALRPGQLAVIVPSSSSSSDMGSVYRYNEPGSWTLCGKIGGLPLDTAPIQGSTNGITSGAVYNALSALRNEGYKYMGIATPGSGGTAPGTPNQPVFYVAAAGSYPNFGNLTVASGHLGFLKYSNGSWTVESIEVGKDYDDEISQLQQEVDSLPRGKDYGFFTSSSLLPSGATEEGFAYVGATEPYVIWQFDGTSWSDSGVTANAFTANNKQVQDAVDDYLQDHPTVSGTFLNVAKRKLISLLEKVAFIDEHGQDYINELTASLFLSPIDHIDAVFTQGTWNCYDIYRLEQLKEHLVVTVYYVDGSHSIESDYILTGTLAAGTSTITASVVDGVTGDTVTDTFNVTVIGTTKLYVDGDECTAVTGGWQKKGFNLTAGTPTIAKNSDHLLFKFATWNNASAAGTISTVNKIDVSGKTKCLCEIELYNETGWAGGWIYFPGTLAESTTQAGAFGSDYSSNRSMISSAPGSVTLVTGFQEPNVITTRTSDYISINFNAYQANNSGYTPGAYLKVKRIAIV